MHNSIATHKYTERGNAVIIGIVVLAALVVGGWFLIPSKSVPQGHGGSMAADTTEGSGADAMKQDESNTVAEGNISEDAMMQGEGAEMAEEGTDTGAMREQSASDGAAMTSDAAMQTAGSYEDYAPEKLAKANTGKVVLFFYATWCPTCRAADKALTGAPSIPAGLTILKADYDTQTALKKKYGVTTQDTFVQVDAQGTMLKKWSGTITSGTITADDIAAQVI